LPALPDRPDLPRTVVVDLRLDGRLRATERAVLIRAGTDDRRGLRPQHARSENYQVPAHHSLRRTPGHHPAGLARHDEPASGRYSPHATGNFQPAGRLAAVLLRPDLG